MRAIDIFLRIATVIASISLLFLPNEAGLAVVCAMFFAVGLWGVLYPSGILGWAKAAHRQLDPTDERLWGFTRLNGVGFIAFSVFVALMEAFH